MLLWDRSPWPTWRGACYTPQKELDQHHRACDEATIMGDHMRGNETMPDDRDGLLDRDGERSMGVLEVALLVGVLVVFLLVVVFFAATR